MYLQENLRELLTTLRIIQPFACREAKMNLGLLPRLGMQQDIVCYRDRTGVLYLRVFHQSHNSSRLKQTKRLVRGFYTKLYTVKTKMPKKSNERVRELIQDNLSKVCFFGVQCKHLLRTALICSR